MPGRPSGDRLRQSVQRRERLGRLRERVPMRSRQTRAGRRVRTGRQRTRRHAVSQPQLSARRACGPAPRCGKPALARRARPAVLALSSPPRGCQLNQSRRMDGCAIRLRRHVKPRRSKVVLALVGLPLTQAALVLVLMMRMLPDRLLAEPVLTEPVLVLRPVVRRLVPLAAPAHRAQQWPLPA